MWMIRCQGRWRRIGAATCRKIDELSNIPCCAVSCWPWPRPTGWYWTSRDRPHRTVEMRGSGGEQIAVVEGDSGRMLGTVDPGSACATVHPGAVYLHQGESFVVDQLDLENGLALVHAENPDWTT